MKRLLALAVILGISTSVYAEANRWRSPFTPAPGGTPLSKLDEEKQAPIELREMAAWQDAHGRHPHAGYSAAATPRS